MSYFNLDSTGSENAQIVRALDYLHLERPSCYHAVSERYAKVPTFDFNDEESLVAMLDTDPNLADDIIGEIEETGAVIWRDGEVFAVIADATICTDCLMGLVNDDYTGIDCYLNAEDSAAREEVIREGLKSERMSGAVASSALDAENELSSEHCACCGETRAGARHDVFTDGEHEHEHAA